MAFLHFFPEQPLEIHVVLKKGLPDKERAPGMLKVAQCWNCYGNRNPSRFPGFGLGFRSRASEHFRRYLSIDNCDPGNNLEPLTPEELKVNQK